MSAEELGRELEAMQEDYERQKKEEVMNLRLSREVKKEINKVANMMGISASGVLLTSFFHYKDNLFGKARTPEELRKLIRENMEKAKELTGGKRRTAA